MENYRNMEIEVTKNTADWGKEGQMQVNSKQMVVTICVKEYPAIGDHEAYSEWENHQFESREQLDKFVYNALVDGYYLIG